jgi:ornithine cyclodeaminase/alanine dehydrogenase-like protein (mu-crystallin family)
MGGRQRVGGDVTRPGAGGAGSVFPTVVDGQWLRSLVSTDDAIEAAARAFACVATGEVTSPLRSTLSRDRTLLMSAEHVSGSALVKVITSSADGWPDGRPSIEGSVLWIDGLTGRVEAVLDAGTLTALRTGAASGLATKLLARPDAAILAMLGAGDQAADQIAGVRAVRPIGEVRIFSRRRLRSERLCAQLGDEAPGVLFSSVGTPSEAVRGADIVCTATRATAPLFAPDDLEPTVHINAVGAYRKDMCEVPAGAFGRARLVVVDQLDAVLAEAGDLIRALEADQLRPDALVTVAEILAGGVAPAGGLTIFKSVGIAAQDWAVAELVAGRVQASRR